MSIHFETAVGLIEKPSDNPVKDAQTLVTGSIEKIIDTYRCPPRLLNLWLTPAFRPYDKFLSLIYRALQRGGWESVPLIGCSAAACVSERGIFEEGGSLTCFASHLMEVRLACAKEAQTFPERAMAELATDLGLSPEMLAAQLRNRLLFLYLPGLGKDMKLESYRAGEIVEVLRRYCPSNLGVFGGVASAGLARDGVGVQFFGNHVLEGAAVGACASLKTTFGVGVSHGLKAEGREFKLPKNGSPQLSVRRVPIVDLRFASSNSTSLMALSVEDAVVGEKVISASVSEEHLIFSQPVAPGSTFKVLRPDLQRMFRSVRELSEAVASDLRVPERRLSAAMVIGCVGRYRHRKKQGVAVGGAFRKIFNTTPDAAHTGAYLDGELSGDSHSPFKLSNWSTVQMLLADELRDEQGAGVDALAESSQSMFTGASVSDAMKRCLECIQRAGYLGGMISLIAKQRNIDGIVGREAFGAGWENVVLKHTVRRLNKGTDILAVIAREKKAYFIDDAQTSAVCNNETARLGGVFSFYGAPLSNELGEVFGILQIDLGDLRRQSLPADQEKILELLARMTAAALNRATIADELILMRKFDTLLPECAGSASISDAVAHFVRGASDALNADVHIRLLDPANPQCLQLVGGTGDYYNACSQFRSSIPLDSRSPGARAVRERTFNAVNDADDDPEMRRLLKHSRHAEVRRALRDIKAYANFPIFSATKHAMGFVCVAATQKYSLTPSRLRTLQHIAGRLSLLLAHIQQKMAKDEIVSELKFLQAISPLPAGGATISRVLNLHLQRIAEAAGAEVAACFLRDEIQQRLVLRAQYGWHSERAGRNWLNSASYQISDGFTGYVAASKEALYVANLRAFTQKNGLSVGKWLPEMFGEDFGPKMDCEVIGLPLWFSDENRSEGALLLYRRGTTSKRASSGFSTTKPKLLNQAAKIYSAFITALLRVDLTGWRAVQDNHLQVFSDRLLKLQLRSLDEMLARCCETIIEEYGFRYCFVYLKPGKQGLVVPDGIAVREDIVDEKNFLPGREITDRFSDVICSKEPFTIRSADNITERTPLAYGTANIPLGIILPIKIDRQPVGVLVLLWERRRRIKDTGYLPHHDEARLQLIADQLGIAIKNTRSRCQSDWQDFQLDRAKNRLVAENRIEACDLMAGVIVNGLQDVETDFAGVARALRDYIGVGMTNGNTDALTDALAKLQRSHEALLEKTREVRTSLSAPKSKPQLISVMVLLFELKKRLQAGLQSRGIELVIRGDSSLTIKSVKNELFSLIEELLFGAVLSSSKCSEIIVEARTGDEDRVEIEILDAAVPLDAEVCERINQLETPRTRLGRARDLFLSHRVAHASGGTLTVSPERDGNRVSLRLPKTVYD